MLEIINVEKDIKDKIYLKSIDLRLNNINSSRKYILKKLGAKVESKFGYPKAYQVSCGNPCLIGYMNNESVDLCLVFFDEKKKCLKTSTIIYCDQQGSNFEVETKNSFYRLELM